MTGESAGPPDLVEPEAIARSFQAARERGRGAKSSARNTVAMAKRSYGTGSLYVARDSRGHESWYGRWHRPAGERLTVRRAGEVRLSRLHRSV